MPASSICLVLLAILAMPASAATFKYQGQGFFCYPDADVCIDGPGWTGRLTVDETKLPGGQLANGRLGLGTVGDIDNWTEYYLDFTGPAGSILQSWTGPTGRNTFSRSPYVRVSGFLDMFVVYAVSGGGFEWTFDQNGNVSWWSGTSMQGFPGIDPYSSTEFDGYDSPGQGTQSYGPGTWTQVAPAPVPLPAAGTLLAVALGVMGFGRRFGRMLKSHWLRVAAHERPGSCCGSQ